MTPPGTGGADAEAERFRFVMAHFEASDVLDGMGIGPAQMIGLPQGVAIGLRVLPTTAGDAACFDRADHRRQDGKPLRCISALATATGSTAFAGVQGDTHVAVVDAGHVARIACICDRMTPVIRRRSGYDAGTPVKRDFEVQRLLRRFNAPTWAQANEVVSRFPDPFEGGQPFGGYMAFQDAVRLIWVHEWAHVVLGHAEIWHELGGAGALAEHSDGRDGQLEDKIEDVPWAYALQCFELQADQFAARFIADQILYGDDPAARIAGPSVDLVQRLAVLAAACALLAVDTFLVEGDRPPHLSSHPGAALRYMTMLHTIEECALHYENPQLCGWLRVAAFGMIEQLAELSGDFHALLGVTPMIAKTPQYKNLCEVQDFLMEDIGERLHPLRMAHTYFPTAE